MKKILLLIKKNYLFFSYKEDHEKNIELLINTNVISDNELVFSEDYIKNNPKIVSLFINELCETHNITKVSIEKNDLAMFILDLFTKNNYIKSLYLLEEKNLPFTLCDKIVKLKKFNYLNCYTIPGYLIEILDKNNIEVISRNEMLFSSKFMEENNLNQFSKIFYKISLRLSLPMSKTDQEDFLTFCKINKYLRTIHLSSVNMKDLEFIVKVLKENKVSKINIMIHDNITNPDIINYLRKENKKAKKHKIYFKLVYSDEFLEKNIINQTLVTILRTCGVIIASIVIMIVGYVTLNNYQSLQEVSQIQNDLTKVIQTIDTTEIVDELNKELENAGKEENVVVNDYLASLLTVNKDTVGWIKVPNTNIDYPVVQGIDNDYYLDYNFYNEKDRNGWVFMDYRNEKVELDKNTIFYAHNRYSSGVMFGPLMDCLYKKWYTNPENQYIEFNTLYGNYKWKIFAIYKIDVTNDYLRTTFANDKDWLEFANALKNRSIYDFKIEIGPNDKIITLSTCSNKKNQRMVVHAVWQANENQINENEQPN